MAYGVCARHNTFTRKIIVSIPIHTPKQDD